MTTAKEIRSKIGGIKNIQKITKAMQMVAASKMRKAQQRMNASRPYADKILYVISHLMKAHPEYRHIFMEVRPVKCVGFIIITTDRGLCGSLNTNELRVVVKKLKEYSDQKVEQALGLVGNKADSFFRRFGGNIIVKANRIDDETGLKDLIGAVKVMTDSYRKKYIDALFLCSNEFVNTMVQRPKIQPLLPIASEESKETYIWDYIYEPDSKMLLDQLLTRYIESQVYQAAVENLACEQAARMLSMKSATDNAGKLMDDLKLIYNKARQAAITNEISEIVSGAQAIDS